MVSSTVASPSEPFVNLLASKPIKLTSYIQRRELEAPAHPLRCLHDIPFRFFFVTQIYSISNLGSVHGQECRTGPFCLVFLKKNRKGLNLGVSEASTGDGGQYLPRFWCDPTADMFSSFVHPDRITFEGFPIDLDMSWELFKLQLWSYHRGEQMCTELRWVPFHFPFAIKNRWVMWCYKPSRILDRRTCHLLIVSSVGEIHT